MEGMEGAQDGRSPSWAGREGPQAQRGQVQRAEVVEAGEGPVLQLQRGGASVSGEGERGESA